MIAPRSIQRHIHRIRPSHRPRGIAVVMVLGLLAITLAISYATLRGQGTTSQLSRNNSRALDARAAAQSGLAAAIRRISQNDWAGIGVPLSANITNNTWYQVNFTTGDTSLQSGDPQYSELPFRVTIDATGYAADPLNTAVRSEHRCRCVVQLTRKQLLSEPANWSALTNYNVYQYSNKDALVQFPVRISGPTCLMGKLVFCSEYPSTTPLNLYLTDLNGRRTAGKGDDRPFAGPVTLRGVATTQSSSTVGQLITNLGVLVLDTSATPQTPLSHPGTVEKYRLYPGGAQYDIPAIDDSFGNPLQNKTLGPDPASNPLGIYRTRNTLKIQSNVKITGTIITSGGGLEIDSSATGVVLKPASLPSLYGSSDSYQLPGLLVADDLRVNGGTDAQVEGMTVVWDEFEVKNGVTASKFSLKGNLIASTLQLRGRTGWAQSPTSLWNTDRSNFQLQLLNVLDLNRSLYFPDYMEKQKGFTVKPTLTFSEDSSGVKPHWHDWSQPIYQPDPADPGLRWEVVRWEDNL